METERVIEANAAAVALVVDVVDVVDVVSERWRMAAGVNAALAGAG